AAALIHADSRLGPQLRQHGDLPGLAFEGESALDADDGSASTARTHCRRNVADMPPLDAIASQSQDVSGEHVDPAQPAPGRRPYGPSAVKGDRIGELFRPHGLRQAHLARADKASQPAATPRTSPTRARVSPREPSHGSEGAPPEIEGSRTRPRALAPYPNPSAVIPAAMTQPKVASMSSSSSSRGGSYPLITQSTTICTPAPTSTSPRMRRFPAVSAGPEDTA